MEQRLTDLEKLFAECVDELIALKKAIADLPCEYNLEWIKQLHNENEGLSCIYGDGYVTKLREMEADIITIKAKINEMLES